MESTDQKQTEQIQSESSTQSEASAQSNDERLKKALQYIKGLRQEVDPSISNQVEGIISVDFLKEPIRNKSGKTVYGFIKLRGNYATREIAENEAEKIIKNVDSKRRMLIGQVGTWLPLTDSDELIKDKIDVRLAQEEKHLRDKAAKETEAKQKRIIEELKQREQEVEKRDIYDDREALRYYSMKRVTDLRLLENLQIDIFKLKELKKKFHQVRKELRDLDVRHPEYKEQWVECYNAERRPVGWPDYVLSNSDLEHYEEFKEKDPDYRLDT